MKPVLENIFITVSRRTMTSAPASWTAAALCRFGNNRHATKSGRGLPQSKTLRSLDGFSLLLAVFVSIVLAGCSKPAADKPADAPEKAAAPTKAGVTIDVETQARLGLKMEAPVSAEWQPQLRAAGRVVDPLLFTAAAADYETARAGTEASRNELERTQKLAAQNNASPRALETAQAMAAHDLLALKSARSKFTSEWGVHLAARTNLVAFGENLQTDDTSLVKLSLPVGTFPHPPPTSATVSFFNDETNRIAADFADDLGIDPATQVETLLFLVNKKLPPSAAVTGLLKTSDEPVAGVVVPPSAVLRHEGKGWIYVQTETNQFVRTEIPLDRLMDNGWFVSENLAATNLIVISGAQTILSAELSGGGFLTGARD
jgi:hypothetical protein